MVLWWIGNVVFLLAIIPVVILLLNRVLRPILEIKSYADDVLEHGVALTGTLDSIGNLNKTRQLAGAARQAAGSYISALERVF